MWRRAAKGLGTGAPFRSREPPARAAAIECPVGGRVAFLTLFGPGPAAGGRVLPLDDREVVLGRDPASDLVCDHREVSRHHAAFRAGASGWEVHDLGSSNGIRIQGHRMEAALLTDGDEVRIGPFRIIFSSGPSPVLGSPPPPPPPPRSAPPRRARAPRTGQVAGGRTGAFVAGLVALTLVPAVVAALAFRGGRRETPPAAAPPAAVPGEPAPEAPPLPDEPLPPAASWPPAPDAAVAAEVDRAAASLEAALGAGKVEEALVHVHPAAASELRAAFEPRRAELPRVARLLATRKLVVAEEAWAEYEVTEDGRTYAVVFEKQEGRWLLSSL